MLKQYLTPPRIKAVHFDLRILKNKKYLMGGNFRKIN